MNKTITLTVLVFVALIAFNVVLKPSLHRRDAIKIVSTVLDHWESNNLTLAMPYWEKEIDSPPVYGLIDYEIGKDTFSKKDGIYSSQIAVTLNFTSDNLMPTGRTWIFDLKKTRVGWKIIDFRLSDNSLPL